MVRAVLYCTFPLKVEYLYLWEMTVLFSKDREIHYLKVEVLRYVASSSSTRANSSSTAVRTESHMLCPSTALGSCGCSAAL